MILQQLQVCLLLSHLSAVMQGEVLARPKPEAVCYDARGGSSFIQGVRNLHS